ncbi:MAG: hypothetical protein Q8M09_15115 [Pseudomonadota bacterium]|nr:hypothetical protein [Pseudomonadota bacterium]MDP1905555.1 hypothetical protein [Pseudomonadota bacterium]
MPGTGFIGATASELASAQAKVFAFDWLEHRNPGVEEFKSVAGKGALNGN